MGIMEFTSGSTGTHTAPSIRRVLIAEQVDSWLDAEAEINDFPWEVTWRTGGLIESGGADVV